MITKNALATTHQVGQEEKEKVSIAAFVDRQVSRIADKIRHICRRQTWNWAKRFGERGFVGFDIRSQDHWLTIGRTNGGLNFGGQDEWRQRGQTNQCYCEHQFLIECHFKQMFGCEWTDKTIFLSTSVATGCGHNEPQSTSLVLFKWMKTGRFDRNGQKMDGKGRPNWCQCNGCFISNLNCNSTQWK